jgi:hypothetical protein
MGRIVYEYNNIVIERLFGRRFKLPVTVYKMLVEKRRLPLFTESTVNGFGVIFALVIPEFFPIQTKSTVHGRFRPLDSNGFVHA